MLPTLPRPGSGLQTLPETGSALPCVPVGGPDPDPAVFAGAVARYRVLERLRGFRQSLYECLDARWTRCSNWPTRCCAPIMR